MPQEEDHWPNAKDPKLAALLGGITPFHTPGTSLAHPTPHPAAAHGEQHFVVLDVQVNISDQAKKKAQSCAFPAVLGKHITAQESSVEGEEQGTWS